MNSNENIEKITYRCDRCSSPNIVRSGRIGNKKRWKCKNCRKYTSYPLAVSSPFIKKEEGFSFKKFIKDVWECIKDH